MAVWDNSVNFQGQAIEFYWDLGASIAQCFRVSSPYLSASCMMQVERGAKLCRYELSARKLSLF